MKIAIARKIDILVLLKFLKIITLNSNHLYHFSCLFHASKSGLSCNINQNNKVWCWGCEKAYDNIDIYKKKYAVSFDKAVFDLNLFYHSPTYLTIAHQPINPALKGHSTSGISKTSTIVDDQTIIHQKKQILKKYSPLLNQITNYYHQQLLNNAAMLKYLQATRKLSLPIIKQFKIGYSNKQNNQLVKHFHQYQDLLIELDLIRYQNQYQFYYDTAQDCLILPVLHHQNTMHLYLNNFQHLNRFKPKYKALKNFTQTPIFYYPFGFSFAQKAIIKRQTVIIHEGFYDVINTHQHQFTNVIGLITIKSNLSLPLINFFKQHQIKVIIALDNDASGRLNAKRLQTQLNNEKILNEIKTIPLADSKDADDVLKIHGRQGYQQIFLS